MAPATTILACSSMDLDETQLGFLVLGFFLWALGTVLLFANLFLVSTARSHRLSHWRWFSFALIWGAAFLCGLLPGEALGSGGPHSLFIFYGLTVPIFVIAQFIVLLVQRLRANRKARAFQTALSSSPTAD